jgi:hypothetical protein
MGGNCDGTYFDELYYGEPVHEPATMLLLGFGVVLFAGCSGKFVKTWGLEQALRRMCWEGESGEDEALLLKE